MESMFAWCLGFHPISLQVPKTCQNVIFTVETLLNVTAAGSLFSDLFLWLRNQGSFTQSVQDRRCSLDGYQIRESPDSMGWNVKADLKAFSAVLKAPSGFDSFLNWEKSLFFLICWNKSLTCCENILIALSKTWSKKIWFFSSSRNPWISHVRKQLTVIILFIWCHWRFCFKLTSEEQIEYFDMLHTSV